MVFISHDSISNDSISNHNTVDEMEETMTNKINLNRRFIVLEKMDGSMISPFHTEGRLRSLKETKINK